MGLGVDPGDRTLVLVELYGGNDGLSTIVPKTDDAYYKNRPTTFIPATDTLPLDDYRGFNPLNTSLRELWDRGECAIVEGVGYPKPVYSHFKSFEIWHTAREAGHASGDGWIGRLRDVAWASDPRNELVVHVGSHVPYSIRSRARPLVAFQSPENFTWVGNARDQSAYSKAAESSMEERGSTLESLRETLRDAQSNSPRILAAAQSYKPRAEYRPDEFGNSLRVIASLIQSGFGSRVYSVALGNFDTHGPEQVAKHAELTASWDGGIGAFLSDLRGTPAGEKTLVVCFSEFGRRVEENFSRGTDHGAAGPMFLLGPMVRGGLYGKHPSITDLDQDGNLKFNTDFRRVYGSILERWFGMEQERVLPARYEPLPVFRV
jgi:uncharacterized protein (DUF1501 family)